MFLAHPEPILRRVYLDHNASSPMSARVRECLAAALQRYPGNASSPHAEGQSARHALEEAREAVAEFAGVRASEVVFTSGGSESNNTALRGVVGAARGGAAARIVTSSVEHPSVLETCRALEREGVEVTCLRADARGMVDPAESEEILSRQEATLVSVMHANNETGVIQPVEELARLAREAGVPFHTDMAQSAGRIPIRASVSASSLVTLASHKVGGPPGIGALIVKEGTPFAPLIAGGAQEGRRRAGTEPVALAVAFAEALRTVAEEAESEAKRLGALRDFVEEALSAIDPRCRIHGRGAPRLPNTTNVFFPGAPGRTLVVQLDLLGCAVSTGSACSTGSARASHVLAAMGCSEPETLDSLRISLGDGTTREEVAFFLGALSEAVARAAGTPAGHAIHGRHR